MSKDPIGIAGGINKYLYAAADPISFSDIYGLAPGDSYSTLELAAKAALADAWIATVKDSDGREYGGFIYRRGDGTFSYQTPVAGTDKYVLGKDKYAGLIKEGLERCEPAGTFHTHPPQRFWAVDVLVHRFSVDDFREADTLKLPSFLSTVIGNLKYTPQNRLVPLLPPRLGGDLADPRVGGQFGVQPFN